jgi:multidrug efflux pump subunit AcrA (membrane-fusion protein)
MDYIPVYEGEADDEPAAAQLRSRSAPRKCRSSACAPRRRNCASSTRQVRAAGRIEIDERRSFAITPKFEGYVERLHVNVTGQPVAKGQPLFEVYSPELVSAQREYTIAAQGVEALKDAGSEARSGMQQLAESSLLRLQQLGHLGGADPFAGKIRPSKRTLTFRSPVSGVVTEKKALQGMRFMPGDTLYQVADLSSVWVVADVFEQDIGQVRTGAMAKVRINAYPDKVFEGRVTYVYPTLNPETRTVPVRVELANPGQLLKPAMFAQVEVPVGGKGQVVTVPTRRSSTAAPARSSSSRTAKGASSRGT